MKLYFKTPHPSGSLSYYNGMPVELNGPILSESGMTTAGLVSVAFPNGVVMDAFTDELYIREN